MSRPVLLDLFCGAGGAAVGYHRAGSDIVGVDIAPQPNYPFEFHLADALLYAMVHAAEFDAVHASPPCHAHSALNNVNRIAYDTADLLAQTREILGGLGIPYVIENVPGAPMRDPVTLCGSEFGLSTVMEPYGEVWLRRHRLFESNFPLTRNAACSCRGKWNVGVYGHGAGGSGQRVRGPGLAKASREVMGIDWMTRDELDESIPPAYTQHVGQQLLAYLEEEKAA